MTGVALRGLASRRFRSFLTALAIVLGVAMICGTFVLTDSVTKAFDTIFTRSYARSDAVVSGKEVFKSNVGLPPSFDAALLARIRALPEVNSAAGSVSDLAQVIDRDGKAIGGNGPPQLAFGVDPHQTQFSPLSVDRGRWPSGPGEIALDGGTADRGDFRLGDTVRARGRGPARSFRLVGIMRFGGVASLGGATISVFDLSTAQRLFDKQGRLDQVLVKKRHGVTTKALVGAIRELLPRGTQVQTGEQEAQDRSSDVRSFVDILQKALVAFGGLALFVGAFIIFNSLSITVAQRAREFALLRTIGASRGQILRSVLLEAFAIGAAASAAGLFLGLALAKGLDAVFRAIGFSLPQAGLVLEPRTVVAALVTGTLVTVLASLVPAVRATRVPPIAVLREGATVPRSRFAPAVPWVALAVAAAGFGLVALGLFRKDLDVRSRLAALGFGCFAVFMGVALFSPKLVPPLASLLGWPAARFGGAPGSLARENAMRNPGRTAVTAAALMIGLTLVTFVAIFARGLQHSFEAAVNDQLHADYVVTSKDGFTPFDPSSSGALARVPGATVTNVRGDRGRAFGKTTNVTGLDAATIATVYTFDWTAGSNAVLPRLGADGAVVTKRYAEDHHLRVGSPLTVQTPQGTRLALRVAGIYEPPVFVPLLGSISVSTAAFDRGWASPRNLYTFVDVPVVDGGASQALERALAPYPDQRVKTQPDFVDKELEGVNQILRVLYVLLALSVVVSLFGIVNTLVLSMHERTRELGMLRAIGTTRNQVRAMVTHEGVITALIGTALGIGLGIVLSALATAALSDQGVVYAIPVASLVVFALVGAVAGMLSAIVPARRAARLNVLNALQYE